MARARRHLQRSRLSSSHSPGVPPCLQGIPSSLSEKRGQRQGEEQVEWADFPPGGDTAVSLGELLWGQDSEGGVQ